MLVMATAAVAIALSASLGGRQRPAAPLNVVVLVIDDTRWDSIGAAGNRVVKWERRGDRILLRAVSYDVVADAAAPIARAVEAANYNPIVMAFNIEALGKDDAAVIDVTRLFTTDVPEFSGRTRVGARTFDASRSFVERVTNEKLGDWLEEHPAEAKAAARVEKRNAAKGKAPAPKAPKGDANKVSARARRTAAASTSGPTRSSPPRARCRTGCPASLAPRSPPSHPRAAARSPR